MKVRVAWQLPLPSLLSLPPLPPLILLPPLLCG
jgi:hypothetical protein